MNGSSTAEILAAAGLADIDIQAITSAAGTGDVVSEALQPLLAATSPAPVQTAPVAASHALVAYVPAAPGLPGEHPLVVEPPTRPVVVEPPAPPIVVEPPAPPVVFEPPAPPPATIANKIFVGGLSMTTNDQSLHSYFSKYGWCDASVMMDKVTGKSRGFGFCTFMSADEAHAVLNMGQHVVDGKVVGCQLCTAETKGTGRGSRGGPGGGSAWDPEKEIFVGGLPQTCDDGKLASFFALYGGVMEAKVMMDRNTGRSRGFGYITFQDSSSVEMALQGSGQNIIDGKWVQVRRSQNSALGTMPDSGAVVAGGSVPASAPPLQPIAGPQVGDIAQDQDTLLAEATELVQLLTDPAMGVTHFLGHMVRQLKYAAAELKASRTYGRAEVRVVPARISPYN